MAPILAASSLSEYFQESWQLPPGGALGVSALIHALIMFHFFAFLPLFFIWVERKVSGRIQDRLGPTRVGGRFGWLQTVADVVKLIQKEDLVPSAADKPLFRIAPYIACVASLAAFMVLPFSDGWVAVVSDIGLFLLFGILSLEVVGIILAGYSSGSKWALFGGMREAAQMVSYEIPLALAALVPIIAAGTLNPVEVGNMQSGWLFPNWLIFHNPFTFVAFFLFFTVATASCKRAPFDLAEAESELVAGFHTEYSGMRWSFFFLAEYASMFVFCAAAAVLFLGGWHTGILPLDNALQGMRATAASAGGVTLQSYTANFVGMLVLFSKGVFLVFVQMWLRWTLPRLRIDQVMMTCLKYLLPIGCFLFLGATLWPFVLAMTLGRTTLIDWPAGLSKPLGDRLHRAAVARPAGGKFAAGAGGRRRTSEENLPGSKQSGQSLNSLPVPHAPPGSVAAAIGRGGPE